MKRSWENVSKNRPSLGRGLSHGTPEYKLEAPPERCLYSTYNGETKLNEQRRVFFEKLRVIQLFETFLPFYGIQAHRLPTGLVTYRFASGYSDTLITMKLYTRYKPFQIGLLQTSSIISTPLLNEKQPKQEFTLHCEVYLALMSSFLCCACLVLRACAAANRSYSGTCSWKKS
jgi:hypothetical protein